MSKKPPAIRLPVARPTKREVDKKKEASRNACRGGIK